MPNISYIRKLDAPNNTSKDDIIAILDAAKLHRLILKKVANELQFLIQECYYPRVADIHKELLHVTKSNEADLLAYSKAKYRNPKWKKVDPKLLHDAQTVLLVLICQDFTIKKDSAAGLATLNLLALRFYTNTMYKFIKYCNPDYFRAAISRLSHNHLFTTKKTIGEAVLYLSGQVYKKFQKGLSNDDPVEIIDMIYVLRGRINQSVRSFANKYYDIAKDGGASRLTKEDLPEEQTTDKKLRIEAGRIAKEITIYRAVDTSAIKLSQQITKFNRRLAKEYSNTLTNTKYTENLELLIFLLLRETPSVHMPQNDYAKIVKKLMAIKKSTKPVYFKKVLIQVHNQLNQDLGYVEKFDKLSSQSKHISRSYLAYYIAMLVYNHFSN
jgi:hypothetical protein